MLVIFSESEIILIALAKERLTSKQKIILSFLEGGNTNINVTNLVAKVSKEINCSKSAIWNNVNSMKRAGLIVQGNLQNKGIPVLLTRAGNLIVRGIK